MPNFSLRYDTSMLARRIYSNGKEDSLALIILLKNHSHGKFPERRVLLDIDLRGLAIQAIYNCFRFRSRKGVGSLSSIVEDPENGWIDYPVDIKIVNDFYAFYLEELKR